MSDGSSGNAFGEALESMTTNTKKAIGGTIADFTKSAANQVKGNSGVSGSFTPGPFGSAQGKQPANPNSAPGLSGGDLFSPDVKGAQPQQKQNSQQQQPLSQAGQQAAANPEAKTPEEMEKIQKIEQEIRGMHQKYYQEFLAKAEGRDRKTQEEKQEKAQEEQKEEMEDLQKKEEKKAADNTSLQRQQRAAEVKGGMG